MRSNCGGGGGGGSVVVGNNYRLSETNAGYGNGLCNAGGGSAGGRGGWLAGTEEFIMSRLLAIAVSDLDAGVRRAVLASFCRPCAATDSHLAQADALRALFITLNDESSEVRLLAIQLVGRLAPRNPAYALPALRRHLLQLLTELEHSTESHLREESARLMAALVRSCTRLVIPYIAPILRSLMTKLRRPEDGVGAAKGASSGDVGDSSDGGGKKKLGIAGGKGGDGAGGGVDAGGFGGEADVGGVAAGASGNAPGALASAADGERAMSSSGPQGPAGAAAAMLRGKPGGSAGGGAGHLRHIVSVREKAAVLGTIGELAQVGGVGMRTFVPDLLLLIIDGIKMGSTRDIAVITLGQLIESTGYVIPKI